MKTIRKLLLPFLAIVLLAAGCGLPVPSQEADSAVIGQDGPFTIYDCDGEQVALLTELLELVEVEVTPDLKHGVLLKVWEKESLEQARADGVPDPRPYCGKLLEVRRLTPGVFHTVVQEETIHYQDLLTRDPIGQSYAVTLGEEEQIYRSHAITQEDLDAWNRVLVLAELARGDFHWRNPYHQRIPMEELNMDFPDLPDVGFALRSIRAGELELVHQQGWTPQRRGHLIGALNRAAGKPIVNRPDRAFGPYMGSPDTWTMELTWKDTYHIALSCSPEEEPLVAVSLWDDHLWDAICLEDQELFNFVRYSRDGIHRIEPEVFRTYRDLLEQAKQQILLDHVGNPGLITSCDLVQLTSSLNHREEDGAVVMLYDVDFVLNAEKPDLVDWSDGLYLDGDFRIRGEDSVGQLAVRYRDGRQTASVFLSEDHYYANWLACMHDWDYLFWLLNQAELAEINPMSLAAEADADLVLLASCQNFEDARDPYSTGVVLCPRYEVEDFRYFQLETEEQGEQLRLKEGRTLYEAESLSPDHPLLIRMNLPETIPSRGVSFRVGGAYYAYAIAVSGKDGSLLMEPLE